MLSTATKLTGKWGYDPKLTEGDLEPCLRMIGVSALKVQLARLCDETQLFQVYQSGGGGAGQPPPLVAGHKSVTMSALGGLHKVVYGMCLWHDGEVHAHAAEPTRNFGDCTARSWSPSPNVCIDEWHLPKWSLVLRSTRTLVDRDLTAIRLDLEPWDGRPAAWCCKYYRRQHRTDAERQHMLHMLHEFRRDPPSRHRVAPAVPRP
jgi:hypothetical protein